MVKIFYKGTVIWNCIVFCIFSVVYLLIQNAIKTDMSVLGLDYVKETLVEAIVASALAVSSIVSIYKMKRYSVYLFFALSFMTIIFTSYNIWINFDKIVLVVLFFYAVISYYYYQFLSLEVNEAFATPMYDDTLLFSPMSYKIKMNIMDNHGNNHPGILTNWNATSCFAYLDQEVNNLSKEKIVIQIFFDGHKFIDSGLVVATGTDKKGVGIRLLEVSSAKQGFGWYDFFTLSQNMGLQPEFIK